MTKSTLEAFSSLMIAPKRFDATSSPGSGGRGPEVSTTRRCVREELSGALGWDPLSPHVLRTRKRQVDRPENVGELGLAGHNAGQPHLVGKPEVVVNARLPQVTVDDDHPLATHGQGGGQVADHRALALSVAATRDKQRGNAVDVHVVEVGAQQAERLSGAALGLRQRDELAALQVSVRGLRNDADDRQAENLADLVPTSYAGAEGLEQQHQGDRCEKSPAESDVAERTGRGANGAVGTIAGTSTWN